MVSISVVVPVYNAERWLADALRSVLEQDYPRQSMEITVVDDGSTDRSADIVKRDFGSVRLIRTKNHGPSHARNMGIRASTGAYVQFLDADDLLAPGKLRRQIEALEKSGADVAYGDWQRLVQKEDRWVESDIIRRRLEEKPELELLRNFWCPPAVYLFRRRIVEKGGGWNEDLPLVEDVRFVIDCAIKGAAFVYCPGIMARYRDQEEGSLSTSDPITFTRCCLKNAQDVEGWWRMQGGITGKRQETLIKAYRQVARSSFQRDRRTFERAYEALERLNPGYVPDRPLHLALAARVVGYRRAEALAVHYRRAKSALKTAARTVGL